MSVLELGKLAIGERPFADRDTPYLLLGPMWIIDSEIVNEGIADKVVQHLRLRFATLTVLPRVELFQDSLQPFALCPGRFIDGGAA